MFLEFSVPSPRSTWEGDRLSTGVKVNRYGSAVEAARAGRAHREIQRPTGGDLSSKTEYVAIRQSAEVFSKPTPARTSLVMLIAKMTTDIFVKSATK